MASLPAYARDIDRRVDDRARIDRPAVLRIGGGAAEIRVEDLTRDGCRITTATDLELGSVVTLGFAGIGQTEATVMWREASSYGCLFEEQLPPGAVTAAMRNNVDHFAGPDAARSTVYAADVKWSPRSQVLLIVGATSALWLAVAGGLFLVG